MLDDSTFRLLFRFVAGVFAVVWSGNLLLAGIERRNFYTAAEGAAAGIPLRVFFISSIVSIVAYLINPDRLAWAALSLPPWVRWSGFILGVFALALFIWVIRSLGRNFSLTLTIKPEQTLVTRGPYRWVRHPMYPTFILIWLSFFLLSANWFIGLTGILGFVWTMTVRTPREEQMMIERFGIEYVAYMKHTPRYLPVFRRKDHGL